MAHGEGVLMAENVELVTLSKQKEGYYQLQFVDIDNVLYTFFVSESVMFTISELYNRESGNR